MTYITAVHRSDLRITSKATALEFYEGIRACVLIPCDTHVIRIEPNRCFTVFHRDNLTAGKAWMIPSVVDDDGIRAYRYRKYINAWLTRE